MSAEGTVLYYEHDWSISAHMLYKIYAWSMWAEGVCQYYEHDWSVSAHTVYKIYMLGACGPRV